jgi:hypothetical protein
MATELGVQAQLTGCATGDLLVVLGGKGTLEVLLQKQILGLNEELK